MKGTELKGYKIESVNFVNTLPGNARIELSSQYSYNVGYSKDGNCKGEFNAKIFDKNAEDKFFIELKFIGFFAADSSLPKEKIHLLSYDMIFPYVKAAVSTITTAAGIPPVMLPYIDISSQKIYRMEMPQKDNGTGNE